MKNKCIPLNFLCVLAVMLILGSIFLGNHVVTVFSEQMEIENRHCVIIDAGHGGEDGGATSCTGQLESRYNLEIAMRLNDMLRFLGRKTKMIRTSDISIYTKGETIAQKKVSDLKERVRICNETENATLISIHQNMFPDSRYSGAQVFYSATEGSQTLAKHLQDMFQSTFHTSGKRQIKKAEGIYLMEHIQCTGVLVECGFLSNPQEEAKLRDPTYQKQLCCVIAATTSNFLDG